MKASETDRGVAWLSNFKPEDQLTARHLLDSVEFVRPDVWWTGLRVLLDSLPGKVSAPIALVPVRELARGQAYFGHDRNAAPKLLLTGSLPGSEGAVATLLNTIRRLEENAGPFTAAPSLKNLRASRAKSIVFVDDYSGSGDRIYKFKHGFHKHSTLRSWTSMKLFNYEVAVYAATALAADRLRKTFGPDRVHIYRVAPTFASRNWSKAQRELIEGLCARYKYGALETPAGGHAGSQGLLAFSHTAPNNLPPILWQKFGPAHDGAPWRPFFLGKAVPPDLQPLFAPRTEKEETAAALLQIPRRRSHESLQSQFAPVVWRKLLLVLLAIARNPRTDLRIGELTSLALADVLATLAQARRCGLVSTTSYHLTDAGRAELRHAERLLLPGEGMGLLGRDEPYYPSSLRVGR